MHAHTTPYDSDRIDHTIDELLVRYVIKDGWEHRVSRRMNLLGIVPALILGALGGTASPWFFLLLGVHLIAGCYLVHRMYELGWAIYSGTLGQWGYTDARDWEER